MEEKRGDCSGSSDYRISVAWPLTEMKLDLEVVALTVPRDHVRVYTWNAVDENAFRQPQLVHGSAAENTTDTSVNVTEGTFKVCGEFKEARERGAVVLDCLLCLFVQHFQQSSQRKG